MMEVTIINLAFIIVFPFGAFQEMNKKEDWQEIRKDVNLFRPHGDEHKSLNCSLKQLPDGIKVDCSFQNLNHIPTCMELPFCRFVIELNLEFNHINKIEKGVFYNFTRLRTLKLGFNPISGFYNYSFQGLHSLETLMVVRLQVPPFTRRIEAGVFKHMQNLKTLNFTEFPIDMDSLWKSLCGLPAEMENVILNRIYMPFGIIKGNVINLGSRETFCLKNKTIRNLSINKNCIALIHKGSLYNLRHNKHIAINKNKLVGQHSELLNLLFFTKLSSFDLSCQTTTHCINPDSVLLSKSGIDINYSDGGVEEILDCEKNDTRFTDMIKICALRNLRIIKASQVNIKFNYMNSYRYHNLCWVNNLIYVDISYNSIYGFNGTIPCYEKLKFLNIRGVEADFMIPQVFHDMPSLEILQMGKSVTASTFKTTSAELLFVKNKKLKFLDLSEIGIRYLNISILKPLKQLTALDLSYNEIESPLFLNELVKDNTLPLLRYVSLRGNRLTILPMILLTHMDHVLHQNTAYSAYLDISKNSFICSCEVIHGLEHFLFYTNVTIPHKELLRCADMEGKELFFKGAITYLKKHCRQPDMASFVFLLLVYPLILLVIIVKSVLFNMRWALKRRIWYAILSFANKYEEPVAGSRNFTFDAFVSYCTADREWVLSVLIPKLENGPNPYKICIHDRNFRPGAYIAENILAAIESSRITILVVSKSFTRSNWCDFEVNAAQKHHLKHLNNGIIAIVLPSYRSKKNIGSSSLQNLLDTVTYIEWPRKKKQEKLEWMKLFHALGKPNTINKSRHGSSVLIQF